MSQLETPALRHRLNDDALDVIFRAARTYNGWLDKPVSDETLRDLYDLMKWGPTSANSTPARFLLLRTKVAKERLRPALAPGNVEKTMSAPVTVIVAYDLRFYEKLPKLAPHNAGPVCEQPGTGRSDGKAEQHAARRIPDHRASHPRVGLRPDVGIRQRQGRRGVLRGGSRA